MTAPNDSTILWRGMTRAELDAAYNNSAAVADSAIKVADWTRRSEAVREQHHSTLDLAYGPRPRNRIDLFRCGRRKAPLLVFIHGGYWQRNAKDMFACMAVGPLARGFDVALIGYTLAPEASLTTIVGETQAAIRWLAREHVSRGKLIVSGWSAGGHLTAMMMGMAEVDAGLPISGVFDVEPCRLNYLNEALKLSAEESVAMSPMAALPPRTAPVVIAYGTGELPELQRQSKAYWHALNEAGRDAALLPLADCNHFSILEELASPDGQLTGALVRLAAR
jgi:acetyl esterase/lipase